MNRIKLYEDFSEESEIDIFCKDSLVDLTDNDWTITVSHLGESSYIISISILDIPYHNKVNLRWSENKDIILTFIQMLEYKYKVINKIRIVKVSEGELDYNFTDINFTDILDDDNIALIEVKFKK